MYILWVILCILFLISDKYENKNIYLVLALTSGFCSIISYKFGNDLKLTVLSFVSFYLCFNFLVNVILKKEEQDELRAKKLNNCIGKYATVTKDIGKKLSIDGIGQIKYNDELWRAKSINDKEIKAGRNVEIVSNENMILNVRVK